MQGGRNDLLIARSVEEEHRRQAFDVLLARSGSLLYRLRHVKDCPKVLMLDDRAGWEVRTLPHWGQRIRSLPFALISDHFDRQAIRSADLVFVLTAVLAKELERWVVGSESKTVIVPASIDPEWTELPPPSRKDRQSPPVVFFQGNGPKGVGRRDLELFVRTLGVLRHRGISVQALFLRVDEAKTRQLCTRFGVPFELAPPMSQPELIQTYDRSAVLAIPSRREGFCIPLIEAAARGTPVVYSNLPHMREVMAGSSAGLGVDDFQLGSWADTMERVLADDETWGEMSRAGPALANRYISPRVAEAVERLLVRHLGPG